MVRAPGIPEARHERPKRFPRDQNGKFYGWSSRLVKSSSSTGADGPRIEEGKAARAEYTVADSSYNAI